MKLESRAPISGLVLSLVFLLGMATTHASDPQPATAPPEQIAPGAPVTDPAIVARHYREMLARPEFQETVEPGIDARFQELLSQWFLQLGAKIGQFKYASRIPAFESLLMTCLVGFAIAGLLYVMARLTRRRIDLDDKDAGGDLTPNARRKPEHFARQIDEALRARDWHTAWLAAWRQFLSRLENGRLVEADRTHTNREYLKQLHSQPLPQPAQMLLTGLVDSYDRHIYGRKVIDEPDWNMFHQQLDEATLLLHLNDKNPALSTKAHPR